MVIKMADNEISLFYRWDNGRASGRNKKQQFGWKISAVMRGRCSLHFYLGVKRGEFSPFALSENLQRTNSGTVAFSAFVFTLLKAEKQI